MRVPERDHDRIDGDDAEADRQAGRVWPGRE
jgi:hypothetical protein